LSFGICSIHLYYQQGQSDNINQHPDQAELLRNSGVTVYTVGVGDYAKEEELKAVATQNSYFYYFDNYSHIDEVVGPQADAICSGK